MHRNSHRDKLDQMMRTLLISLLSSLILLLAAPGTSRAEGQKETSDPDDFADMDLEALLASPVVELGYRARLFDKLRLDAVVFGQQIRNVIGPIRGTVMPSYQDNLDDMDQLGLELGISWAPLTRLRTNLNYTFIYSRIPDSGEWNKNWPAHLWSLGTEWRLPNRCRVNLSVYMIFDHKPWVASLNNMSSDYPYFEWEQRQAADQAVVNLRLGKFFFDDKAEVFFAVKNLVGFWRDEEGLRMLPHNNVQPIGGTLLIGLIARGL